MARDKAHKVTRLQEPPRDQSGRSFIRPIDLVTDVTGTLGVARGGTGRASWTAGSIVFAGAGGTSLTQDNANLFWDDTNKRLGVGTATPGFPLEVVGGNDGNTVLIKGTTTQKTTLNLVDPVGGNGGIFGTVNSAGAGALVSGSVTGDVVIRANIGSVLFGLPTAPVGGPILQVSKTGNIGIGILPTALPAIGNSGLIFGDGAALASMGANTAGLYADDVGGTVNLFAINEADALTRLTGPFAALTANRAELQVTHATTLLSGLTGATATATALVPAGSFVLGVTARVTTTITGATSFDVGDGVDVDRWGAAIALPAGTTTSIANFTANGFGQFTAANNVVLTANGANFTGGAVRITVHYFNLQAATN